jgi:hypothetical protein
VKPALVILTFGMTARSKRFNAALQYLLVCGKERCNDAPEVIIAASYPPFFHNLV